MRCPPLSAACKAFGGGQRGVEACGDFSRWPPLSSSAVACGGGPRVVLMMKWSLAMAVSVVFVVVGLGGVADATTKFTSCDQMHKVYKYGVAKDKSSQSRAVKDGMYRPALKPTVYAASYKTLDRDKDGVMCEVPR